MSGPDPIAEATTWVNSHLKSYKEQMTDIQRDFCDGIKLCHLVSSVCKTRIKIPYPTPINIYQKRKNISSAMMYLENGRIIPAGKIKRDELLWGEVMPTFNLIRMLNIRMCKGRIPPLPPGRYKRTYTAKIEPQPELEEQKPEVQIEIGEDATESPKADFVPLDKMRSLQKDMLKEVLLPVVDSDYKITIDVDPRRCGYVITDPDGVPGNKKYLPNIVCFDGDEVMIGGFPAELGEDNPDQTVIRDLMRVIGVDSIEKLKNIRDRVDEDELSEKPVFVVSENKYTPVQILALVFQQIKDNAAIEAEEEVVSTNVRVPSYFTEEQRRVVEDAVRLAGLKLTTVEEDDSEQQSVLDVVNANREEKPANVLLFDMNSAACSATTMRLFNGKYVKTKATGNTGLGGNSFTERLAAMIGGFQHVDEPELLQSCEAAKIQLSRAESAEISAGGVTKVVKRSEFDQMNEDLYDQIMSMIDNALGDEPITQVILTGPATNMLRLRELIAEKFGDSVELVDGNRNKPIVMQTEKPKSEYTLEMNIAVRPNTWQLVKPGCDPIGSDSIHPVVCFTENHKVVGTIPSGWESDSSAVVIENVVSVLGKDFSDPKLHSDVAKFQCQVDEDENNKPVFSVNFQRQKHKFKPEDIQSMIFEHVRDTVLKEHEENICDMKLVVPSYLTEKQRELLKQAAAVTGLGVTDMADETESQKMIMDRVNSDRDTKPRNVVVFDMNESETTATMFCNENGETKHVCSAGAGNIGGSCFDRLIASRIEMERTSTSSRMPTLSERQALIAECEKAKIRLSNEDEATVSVCGFGGRNLERIIERREFEEICDPLFQSAVSQLKSLVHNSGVSKKDISQVIINGAPTKSPRLRELLCQYLGSDPELIDGDTNERIITKYNKPKSELVVGIDIGTSSCRYSVFRDEGGEQVMDEASKEISSVVSFSNGTKIVGSIPEDDPNAVIIKDVKRIIGRDFSDGKLKIDAASIGCPVEVDAKTGRPVFVITNGETTQKYSPEQIMSVLLQHVKEQVSAETGENIVDVVISVPAFFANAQRQAIKDAATLAGLNITRMVNDPVAAALTFNAEHQEDDERKVLVLDMGAGKLDLALLKLQGGVCTNMATSGNTNLGGIDFDQKLADFICNDIKKMTGSDPRDTPTQYRSIVDACEKAKIELTSNKTARITVNDYNRDLTQEEFDELCDELFNACLDPVRQVLADAGLARGDLAKVILVGKATKMQKLRSLLLEFFGPRVELFDLDANAAVEGAAIQGAMLKGHATGKLKDLEVRNSTPLSFGISLANGTNHIIIPRGSSIPAKFSTPATTVKDGQRNVGFDVVEGERPMASDCIRLGHITVEGIQIAKRGVPKLEVTMEINEDGMLVVTGKDINTGAAMTVRITNSANLSEDDIERMLEEMEQQREEDERRAALAEAKMQYQITLERGEGFIRSRTAKNLPDGDFAEIKQIVSDMREWIAMHENEPVDEYYNRVYKLKALLREHQE